MVTRSWLWSLCDHNQDDAGASRAAMAVSAQIGSRRPAPWSPYDHWAGRDRLHAGGPAGVGDQTHLQVGSIAQPAWRVTEDARSDAVDAVHRRRHRRAG